MRCGLVAVWVACCACSSAPDEICGRGGVLVDRTVPVVVTGVPAQVTMTLGVGVFCSSGPVPATEAVGSVVDGRNQPVASSTSPPSSAVGGYVATLSFTPATPGLYLLTARFEPSLGVSQRMVQVVADHSADTPLARFVPSEACTEIAVMGGTVACQQAGAVEVLRDGGVVQRIAASHFSSSGAVLWTWGTSGVSRFVDTGSGPLVEAALANPVLANVRRTAASTESELVAVAGSTIIEVRYDGGLEVVWGEKVEGAADQDSGLVLAGDTLVWGAEGPSVCRANLTAAGASGCSGVQLTLAGAEGDALWVRAVQSNAIGVLRFPPSALVPTVGFLAGRSSELVDEGSAVPFFEWKDWRVSVQADDLTLEGWKVPGSAVAGGASHSFVWLAATSGETFVFRRE